MIEEMVAHGRAAQAALEEQRQRIQRLRDLEQNAPQLLACRLLQGMFGPVLEAPVTIDSLSIFEQPDRRTPFVETARYRFRG